MLEEYSFGRDLCKGCVATGRRHAMTSHSRWETCCTHTCLPIYAAAATAAAARPVRVGQSVAMVAETIVRNATSRIIMRNSSSDWWYVFSGTTHP